MISNKKSPPLRKLFFQKKFWPKKNRVECHSYLPGTTTYHVHLTSQKMCKNESAGKYFSSLDLTHVVHPDYLDNGKEQNCGGHQPNSFSSEKTTFSALLAAKLRCDEWGLEGQSPSLSYSPSSKTVIYVPPPSPARSRVRQADTSSRSYNYPSRKGPGIVRSRSMKERREAMEKAKRIRMFCSLPRITEVDEMELQLLQHL